MRILIEYVFISLKITNKKFTAAVYIINTAEIPSPSYEYKASFYLCDEIVDNFIDPAHVDLISFQTFFTKTFRQI